jgi:hypothetical protein
LAIIAILPRAHGHRTRVMSQPLWQVPSSLKAAVSLLIIKLEASPEIAGKPDEY